MLDMIGLFAAAVLTCTTNTTGCVTNAELPVLTPVAVEAAPVVSTPAEAVITEAPIVETPRQKPEVSAERKAPKVKLVATEKPGARSKISFKRKIEVPIIIGGYF